MSLVLVLVLVVVIVVDVGGGGDNGMMLFVLLLLLLITKNTKTFQAIDLKEHIVIFYNQLKQTSLFVQQIKTTLSDLLMIRTIVK